MWKMISKSYITVRPVDGTCEKYTLDMVLLEQNDFLRHRSVQVIEKQFSRFSNFNEEPVECYLDLDSSFMRRNLVHLMETIG